MNLTENKYFLFLPCPTHGQFKVLSLYSIYELKLNWNAFSMRVTVDFPESVFKHNSFAKGSVCSKDTVYTNLAIFF